METTARHDRRNLTMAQSIAAGSSGSSDPLRPRNRRRRSSAHSASSSCLGDHREYTYALPESSISEWLKCPICLNPFVEPALAPQCEHVFCQSCIQQHIDTLREQERHTRSEQQSNERRTNEADSDLRVVQCPTCRSPFEADDLKPAAALIRNMVDSLLVRCMHEHRGCMHTCERNLLDSHVKRQCQWAYVGEYDGMAEERIGKQGSRSVSRGRCECGKRVLRKDWHHHISMPDECTIVRVACPFYSSEEGQGCREYVKQSGLQEHVEHCQARPVECEYCQEAMTIGDLDLHLDECPESNVTCSLKQYGCQWEGRRAEFETSHQAQCRLAPFKNVFEAQSQRISGLQRENQQLNVRMNAMQTELSSLSELVGKCVQALGSTFIGTSTTRTGARRHPTVVPISSPHVPIASTPPTALQGRSGSSTALDRVFGADDGHHAIGQNDPLSISAPATAQTLPAVEGEGSSFLWPDPNDRDGETSLRPRRNDDQTVSQAVDHLSSALETVSEQQTRAQRRLDDAYAVSLNAGFEAGRAHEELNSLRHGMHSVRMQMHSLLMQQQHMMPAMFLGGTASPATNAASSTQVNAASNAIDAPTFSNPTAMPFGGPAPPQMGLRRFWTGFEQTRL